MSESTLKKTICDRAKKVDQLRLVRRMTAGNNAGEPDIFGIFNGKHVEIEVKVEKNQPTPLQLACLRTWATYSAIAGCVWSLTDVFKLLVAFCDSREQLSQLEKAYNKGETTKLMVF